LKAILNPPSNTSPEDIADLRTRIENIFHRTLRIRDKKVKVNIKLDIALVECFSTLSPKSRDEEFEDIVYFILDLYQAHGVPVVLSEVDVDQVAVELRTAMEEHAARVAAAAASQDDVHMFLVLDKNLQGLPWESIPVLRGRSVSRIPNMAFLLDRLDLANLGSSDASSAGTDRIAVDPRKATVILNPSGDLKRTEARFKPWLQDMKKVGWSSIVGRAPSEQEFVDALARKDLVMYVLLSSVPVCWLTRALQLLRSRRRRAVRALA
jgi:separase